MKRFDKKLPRFRHGLERHPPQRIRVYRNTPPAQNAQAFDFRRRFNGGASIRRLAAWKKPEAQPENLRQRNSLLLGARTKEGLRNRRQ
jgi:hypothetical protein